MKNNLKLNQLPGCVKTFVVCYFVLVVMVIAFPAYMHAQKEAKEKSSEQKAMLEIGQLAWAHGDEVQEAEAPQMKGSEGMERKNQDTKPAAKRDKSQHLLKAAHVHLGGHTLLFFTVGLLFALTTLACWLKSIAFVLTTLSILIHTAALAKMEVLGMQVLKSSMIVYTLSILFMVVVVVKEMFAKGEE